MTYQLHVPVSDDLERDLRAYADKYGMPLTVAVRMLLHKGLETEGSL